MKPHKHAELIKAWAAGAEIQVRSLDHWSDCEPTWAHEHEYRTKPKLILFRNYFYGTLESPKVSCVTHEANERDPRNLWELFIGWIGPWQEVDAPLELK